MRSKEERRAEFQRRQAESKAKRDGWLAKVEAKRQARDEARIAAAPAKLEKLMNKRASMIGMLFAPAAATAVEVEKARLAEELRQKKKEEEEQG